MADFFVHVGGERGEAFERVLGPRRVPVRSPIATRCKLPIGERSCYLLDVEALDADQTHALLTFLAETFGTTYADAVEELFTRGLPILADGCHVTILHPQRWL